MRIKHEKSHHELCSSMLHLTFIQIPKRVNWEEYVPQGSDQWEWQMVVSKMFDERPIWPKESLTERLLDKGLSLSALRRLLSRIAYYFSSGPFLRFWIRKGYDPRKDHDSCM
jgi:general transcription factor 3C polypeptide 5 (transcription factor C subunit 1)